MYVVRNCVIRLLTCTVTTTSDCPSANTSVLDVDVKMVLSEGLISQVADT